MAVLDHPGFAVYSIPVVWILAYIPAFMRNWTVMFTVGGYDNITPRNNDIERLPDPVWAGRAKRMDGAHQNGLEAFPLWVAAVLAGTVTGVDRVTMNSMAIAVILLRASFLVVYVLHTKAWQSLVRSMLWLASTCIALSLVFMAAVKASSL